MSIYNAKELTGTSNPTQTIRQIFSHTEGLAGFFIYLTKSDSTICGFRIIVVTLHRTKHTTDYEGNVQWGASGGTLYWGAMQKQEVPLSTTDFRGYQKAVKFLIQAQRIEDLFPFKSLHFEALHGDREGRFSVKANDQYRVEFSIEESDDEPVVTICNVLELSNHYK